MSVCLSVFLSVCLSDRRHDVNHLHPQSFVSLCENKVFEGCLCLILFKKETFWAVFRRYGSC